MGHQWYNLWLYKWWLTWWNCHDSWYHSCFSMLRLRRSTLRRNRRSDTPAGRYTSIPARKRGGNFQGATSVHDASTASYCWSLDALLARLDFLPSSAVPGTDSICLPIFIPSLCAYITYSLLAIPGYRTYFELINQRCGFIRLQSPFLCWTPCSSQLWRHISASVWNDQASNKHGEKNTFFVW